MGKRWNIIYEPAGAAAEYAPLAANLFTGCVHGCKYCYVPRVLRTDAGLFHSHCQPRRAVLELLRQDIEQHRDEFAGREILLCFTCDPYQTPQAAYVTRQAIRMIGESGLKMTVLTKGRYGGQDIDLLAEYGGRLGVTYCFEADPDRFRWEPKAAPLSVREEILTRAKEAGVTTWISLEPVIYPDQALLLVERLDPLADKWMVGRLNHRPVVRGINWREFVKSIVGRFKEMDADFYIKESLRGYLDE